MSRQAGDEQHAHPQDWIGHALLGLNDGITTTLVFALSVAGATPAFHTVILAGVAEMLAGGVAMFLGGFVSALSTLEAAEHQISVERHEIEHEPEEERAELTAIYQEKGFSGSQLTQIVDHLTSDKDRWLKSIIRDELLLQPERFTSPWQVASILGLSFMVGALIPLFPFFFHLRSASILAVVLSIGTLFGTGAARSRFSHRSWLASGLQMVLVGLAGTIAGVLIGTVLSSRL